MKRIILLFVIAGAVMIYGCKANKAPGAPLDAILTATPTPHYNISFTVFSTQTPLAGATCVLVYPDATRTVSGSTDADGKINYRVSDSGNYTLYVKHSSIPDSNTYPLFNNYNVSNGTNDYAINIDIGSLTLLAHTGKNISYTAQAADYIYYLKYINPNGMHRKITASLGYGSWVTGIYDITTITPAYIDEPGSSLNVRVSLPDYFHQNDTNPAYNYSLTMNTNVVSGAGMSSAFYIPAYADWLFSTRTAAAVVFDSSAGRISTTIQLYVQNVDITNVCMRINKYEYYIGGQWVDHTYYNGTADYKIGGYSTDVTADHCFLNANNFVVSLGYPGLSVGASKGRLTLDFIDKTSGSRIIQAIIQN